MCSDVAPRVSRGVVRDLLNLIITEMFDKKYATSEVGISRHEIFKGLDKVDVRGLVVRFDGPTEDAAIDPLSGASDGGVPLRAKGRSVD